MPFDDFLPIPPLFGRTVQFSTKENEVGSQLIFAVHVVLTCCELDLLSDPLENHETTRLTQPLGREPSGRSEPLEDFGYSDKVRKLKFKKKRKASCLQ
jgi:hypothetical protein